MALTAADIIQSVKRQFGDESGAQIDDPDIIRWINEGQLLIQRRTEGTVSSTSASTVIGQSNYTLPTDFFKPSSVTINDRKIQYLSKAQFLTLFPSLQTDAAGTPKFFTVLNKNDLTTQIMLGPKPSLVATYVISYVSRPPVITASSDNLSIPNTYYETLITYCLGKAKELDGDMDGSMIHIGRFNQSLGDDAHDARHQDEETYPFIRTSSGDF